jgi:hypothetical protein
MVRTDRTRLQAAIALLLNAILAPGLAGAGAVVGHDPRVSGGGADGGGSLPQAFVPGQVPVIHLADVATPTIGIVVDVTTRQPVSGAVVIITDGQGLTIAADVTDGAGKFMVLIHDAPDLELAIPSKGVFGVQVQAGEALMVLVP